jgi:hypothetical protein
MKAKVVIEWLCLVIQDNDRSRVVETARNRAPSHDCGSTWLSFLMNGKWYEYETGWATRGKWRIPNGKAESGMFSCSELRRW